MSILRVMMILASGLSLSACAVGTGPFEVVDFDDTAMVTSTAQAFSLTDTPAAVAAAQPGADEPAPDETAPAVPSVRIRSVTVDVPRSLKVSEANRFYPGGDIVWRGDAPGDRHAQVQKIFEDALTRGVQPLDGELQADLIVEVKRFHSITEKTRYLTGGVHAITFDLTLKDAATGAVIVDKHQVQADLKAYGGKAAVQADAAGQTMKVRITDHLATVIQTELTRPGGYQNAKLGVLQVLNTF